MEHFLHKRFTSLFFRNSTRRANHVPLIRNKIKKTFIFANDTAIQQHISVNKKHRKILESIFSQPTPGSIAWRKIEALFIALDAKVIEGDGSRVSFVINDEKGDFHRPYPGKEAKRYQVRNAKEFLRRIGITK